MANKWLKNIERTKDDKFLVLSTKDIYELTEHDIVCLACCWCNHITETSGRLVLEEVILKNAIQYLEISDDLRNVHFSANVFRLSHINSYEIIKIRIKNELKKI